MDQAASSTHDKFISWSHALLSDLKGVRHDDEAQVGASNVDDSDNHEGASEREHNSHFTAPSVIVCMLSESSNLECKLSRITPTSVRILFRSKDQVPFYLKDNLME